MMYTVDESRLKATSSFASDATVHKGGNGSSPSPLSQKPSFPPSYDDDDDKSVTIAPPPRSAAVKEKLRKAKAYSLVMLKKYWFLVGLAFVICLGYACPDIARKGGYIRAEYSIKWGAVIIIFIISGLSLRTRILTQTFMRVRLHLLIQIINLVIIPFFVFGLVLLLFKLRVPMNSLVLMGVVIAASTPTTVSSNVVMTKNAKGNEATALMNAAVGNVLGIFISPALVDTFQEPLIEATPENESAQAGGRVDFVSVLKQLGITVLIPLVVGQLIQIAFTEKVAKIKVKWRLSDVSSVALLTMVWSVFSDAFHSGSFNSVGATDIIAVVIMNFGFYILFSLLSLFLAYIPFPSSLKEPSWVKRLRYSREDTVAVMYCGATKTVAMGVPLINVLYENGDPGTIGVLSTPLLLYHVEQLILGNIEVDILKNWVLRGKEKDAKAIPPSRDEEDQSHGGGNHNTDSQDDSAFNGGNTNTNVDDDDDDLANQKLAKEIAPIEKAYMKPDVPSVPAAVDSKSDYNSKLGMDNIPLDDEKLASETMIGKTSSHVSSMGVANNEEHEHQHQQHYHRNNHNSSTGNNNDADDIYNMPLFTSDTASISLDTSRFSSDTLSSRRMSSTVRNSTSHHRSDDH
ncbi:SBF-like CPA transporter family-domain-containing protein [Zychaea mexicana]|uniref:SBF-like CPA transporter family-domain-containing protein n=1 Tax=Zychaea mexicana TaxID=64656 RepID=UPI0022FE0240|nr:SBF-like CPA transporter family-domain-containing protein [Zychaea mexicana]KAI9492199.1 SBF-like CPA transporter family-domain-containing protein [Zychaea mexicana]